ncbi:hypothetical protein EYF80_054400 [Liparis tanakae]|uniref:Uncharacterized protein n=1 Tax=Liparis tanakae TaxID=230148 RepID=A0A4Z2F2R3_9TELE|nr:hypothetical protein EYF80_054400 [Liparis tanakae]
MVSNEQGSSPCASSPPSAHWPWGKTRSSAFSTKEKAPASSGRRAGDSARPGGASARWDAGTMAPMALLKSPGPRTMEATSRLSFTLLP